MKSVWRIFASVALPVVSTAVIAPNVAFAQSASVVACVNNLTKTLGISPDIAFGECNKKSLSECIKSISDSNYIGSAIRKEGDGNLVDLGSNSARWLEGGAWKAHGCMPYIDGPQRITQTVSAWNYNKHQWFRQAVCPQEFVELDQPYGIEDAKLLCETDTVPQRLKEVPKTL